MIKEIVKDIVFLEQKSELATKDDIEVVNDLIDTLRANLDSCVGMAANMIGIKKTYISIYCRGYNNSYDKSNYIKKKKCRIKQKKVACH